MSWQSDPFHGSFDRQQRNHHFLVVEFHWSHPAQRWERWKHFVKEGDIIQKGYITVPDKPGLGIDIDEKLAAKYPCTDEVVQWTQTRLPDGSPTRP